MPRPPCPTRRIPAPTRLPDARRLLSASVLLTALACCAAPRPVAAQPPANQPPAAQPPAGQPPAGQPPAGQPPAQPAKPPDKPLPKLEEMPLPTVEELLTGARRDWIVLPVTNEVLVVQPVSPRPDTLAKMQKALDDSFKWPVPATQKERTEQNERREALKHLDVVLLGEEGKPYKLDFKKVAQVIHHEDLYLRRTAALMDEGRLRQAFEMLFQIARQNPDWPGLAERQDRLLFLQAAEESKRGADAIALVYLEELHARNRKYPDLSKALGETVDRMATKANAADEPRHVRILIARLKAREPGHPIEVKWRSDLLSRAEAQLDLSRKETAAGRHDAAARAAREAARLLPDAPGLKEVHRRATDRFQTLDAGVLRPGRGRSLSPFPSADEERVRRLLATPLFDVDRIDDRAHFRSRFFDAWEPSDLGRRVVCTLRRDREPWEPEAPLTAGPVLAVLRRRLDPRDPAFDERLASFVSAVIPAAPDRFEIRFSRVPLEMEALFRFPVVDLDAPRGSAESAAPPIVSRRFVEHSRTADRTAYRRAVPEPDGLPEYHVAEVVERLYPDYDRAVQGLLRDEVALLPDMPPWIVERLRRDDRLVARPYAVPTVHLVQIDPRSRLVKSPLLRQALVHALDRQGLLERTVLRTTGGTGGKVVDQPVPSTSDAFDPLIVSRAYDLRIATALALVARNAYDGELPKLTLAAPPEPVVRDAAAALVAAWKRIGVEVRLLDDAEAGGAAAPVPDLIYRTLRPEHPDTEVWSLLSPRPAPRVADLAHVPDWLRQEFVRLEEAGDFRTARDLRRTLLRHLWDQAWFLPLWEVEDHVVFRKSVRNFGPSEKHVHPYDRVERWIVQTQPPVD